ncbi:MAG: hypothetical protein DDT19_00215 [Syntrophomonadaceae bacterium]|nr:hypothetical protein [Bacillota bacterium]
MKKAVKYKMQVDRVKVDRVRSILLALLHHLHRWKHHHLLHRL